MTKSTFGEYLVGINALTGFSSWAFLPGMLFDSAYAWWGSHHERYQPHEGLDLCLYVDLEGKSHVLRRDALIPVIYSGKVVKIDDDFLGKTIYVKHVIREDSGCVLYSVYGHTRPARGIDVNLTAGEGEVIATIADTKGKKTTPPPHLHISMVWAPESLPESDLNWATISARQIVKPVDPLEFLALPHVLLT